jgi:aspartyl protease family protein
MSGDDNAQLLYGVLALSLVASSLFARRLPLGQTVRMLLTWVGIFGLVFVLFSFRFEAMQIWKRVTAEFSPGGTVAEDGTLRVRKAEDGHFWIDTQMNGKSVHLMVDSGATFTSLSDVTAAAAGVAVDEEGFPVLLETANGSVEAKRARIARLKVGPILRTDFPAVVSSQFGEVSVLGMNFLSTLKGWRVEGDEMVLNP